jgi:hypothetical protein
MCTDAYREALTRDFSSTASSAPVPSLRQAAQAGREDVAGRPPRRRTNPGQDDLESRGVAAAGAGALAESGAALALALTRDATVADGEISTSADRTAGRS